jgi:CheY-like chemotaxis protein
MLLDIMTQVMNQWGYKTTAFSNSQEALEAFRNHPDEYDLVVSDMAMPKLTGLQLGLKIKEIREDIPIIICSGFSENISHEKARQNGFQAFIMKPVIMSELAEIIRSVLDDQQSDRRKDKRFKAMSGAFIISKANKKEKGKVLDISKSGLSFKCDFESKFSDYIDKATINMADKNFTLDNLKYKTISDTMQQDSNGGNGEIRRRGVQFENLSPIQSEKLDFFIKNYTDGSIN